MKHITTLPELTWGSLESLKEPRPVILISSPKAFEQSKKIISNLKIVDTIFVTSSDKKYAESLVRGKHKGDVIYAIGGGRVSDISRFVAYKWNLEIIFIPTIISTDSFLVDCTGLRENGCVDYVPTKKADKVLLDFNFLKKAPKSFHASGCGDVLSIYTGLFDWKYANEKKKTKSDEKYSKSTALMAQAILEGLLVETKEIRMASKKGLMTIVEALAMEVQLCNFYGNSRPEEGGEHFLTYAIENKLKNFLHGEIVSFGILLTAFIQGQDINKMKIFMDNVGLNYKPKGLDRLIILKTLYQMQSYVRKNKLRYSIYNDLSAEKIKKLKLDKFYSLLTLD